MPLQPAFCMIFTIVNSTTEVDTSTTGNYTCSARNAFGSEEITYKVECIGRPSAPQVTLESVDHTEARLSWRTIHHPQAMAFG